MSITFTPRSRIYSLTVEAKLSSGQRNQHDAALRLWTDNEPKRIMFAASFETSDPEMFMAMPRSAYGQ